MLLLRRLYHGLVQNQFLFPIHCQPPIRRVQQVFCPIQKHVESCQEYVQDFFAGCSSVVGP